MSSSTAESSKAANGASAELSGPNIMKFLTETIPQLRELVSTGRLNEQQIIQQLKEYADKKSQAAQQAAQPTQPQSQPAAPKPNAFRSPESAILLSAPTGQGYPISAALSVADPGPVAWPAARPTLTGGVPGGRIAGTPAQMRGAEEVPGRARRRDAPGEQSMRRSIQDLVSSIDPSVKIDADVEDLLLAVADEFVDSVTNFGCRLVKHRGGDSLEVRDLQLHLERNHNIRIPGFASDETRIALSQTATAPPAAAAAASTTTAAATPAKKTGGGTHMTLRSHRLAQVQQAKRDAKLV